MFSCEVGNLVAPKNGESYRGLRLLSGFLVQRVLEATVGATGAPGACFELRAGRRSAGRPNLVSALRAQG